MLTGRQVSPYRLFRPSELPSVSVLVSTAAYRIAHSMVGNVITPRGPDMTSLPPVTKEELPSSLTCRRPLKIDAGSSLCPKPQNHVSNDGCLILRHRAMSTMQAIKKAPCRSMLAFAQDEYWRGKTAFGQIDYDGDFPVLNVPGLSRPRPSPLWLLLFLSAAVVGLIRRINITRHSYRKYLCKNLAGDIVRFYHLHSAAWKSVWSEHMHHGLYDKVDGHLLTGADAQLRTMSQLLKMARSHGASIFTPPRGTNVLDVGCGIGGASRYLARDFGPDASVWGVALSPKQASRATELNTEQALFRSGTVQIENARDLSFNDGQFDLVWSLESAEQMDDKRQFVSVCSRVLRPGAPFVMLAWCIHESSPPLCISERFAIRKIVEHYCLPRLAPPSEHEAEILRAGLRDIHVEDWTDRATESWNEFIQSAMFNPRGIKALFKYGKLLVRAAMAARHVIRGIKLGAFCLVALTGRKQALQEAREGDKIKVSC